MGIAMMILGVLGLGGGAAPTAGGMPLGAGPTAGMATGPMAPATGATTPAAPIATQAMTGNQMASLTPQQPGATPQQPAPGATAAGPGTPLTSGTASHYGGPGDNTGSRTADGSPFTGQEMVCAMGSEIPFGTIVRVTSQNTGRSVIVRVADRGNFTRLGRVIDLSYAAFAAIDDPGRGLIQVNIEQMPAGTPTSGPQGTLVAGTQPGTTGA